MATTYTTKAGDTVELIAWKYYGSNVQRAAEQLLEANPGLADIGPLLPAGAVLTLPDIDTATKSKGLRLWD